MTRDRYEALKRYFDDNPGMARALRVVCGALTVLVYVFFIVLLAFLVFTGAYRMAFETALVCGVGVTACTVLRSIINSPRPYEVYGDAPTIKRDKSGCSFPSRHAFSIAIIAVAAFRVWPCAGIALFVLTAVLAATRVLGGVHFIKDVTAGVLLAVFWGFVGFWITSLV